MGQLQAFVMWLSMLHFELLWAQILKFHSKRLQAKTKKAEFFILSEEKVLVLSEFERNNRVIHMISTGHILTMSLNLQDISYVVSY